MHFQPKVLISLFLCLLICWGKASYGGEISRIIGGQLASPGEFPYQIFLEKIWNSTKIYKCGGALISPEFVVTAAHCLFYKDFGNFSKPRRIWVTAGTTYLNKRDKDKQETWAKGIFPHPEFRYEGSFPIFDIALVQLNKPFTLSSKIQPVPLPKGGEGGSPRPLKGNGTLSGWGRIDSEGRWVRELRKSEVPLMEWPQCRKVFKGVANITENMFCSGGSENLITPCNGDSGGPIVCQQTKDNGTIGVELCGIASFGAKHCKNYAVYTRVSSFIPWIHGVMSSYRYS